MSSQRSYWFSPENWLFASRRFWEAQGGQNTCAKVFPSFLGWPFGGKIQKSPNYKIYKNTKLQNLQKIPNSNYGIYTYNKIRIWCFVFLLDFPNGFTTFRMHFGIVALFCTINHYFEYRIRIRCIWLYMVI